MLPDFLGIGVRRGGSTWLWELLRDHPDAFVPPHQREVHFFSRDERYARGLEWYETLFPRGEEAERYKAVGEISPGYISSPEAAERIREMGSVKRMLALLRSPVDRTISHYHWRIRFDEYGGSVLDFVRDYPDAVRWSSYSEDVRRYQRLFPAESLLWLIFEETFADVPAARRRIAGHLGLDPERFKAGAGERRVNTGGIPRRRRLYRAMSYTAMKMRHMGLHGMVDFLGRGRGLKRLAEGGPGEKVQIPQEDRMALFAMYREEIERTEEVLGRSLEIWRPDETRVPTL